LRKFIEFNSEQQQQDKVSRRCSLATRQGICLCLWRYRERFNHL